MKQLQIIPTIYEYETFGEFAEEFKLTERDLIFTNEKITTDSIAPCGVPCQILYREKFGKGEPTDVMINDILRATNGMDYDRLIAVGGGAITDIAKAVCVSDCTEDVNEMFDHPECLRQRHELIIIPTTCGTGTEVTNLSIINRTRIGVKQGLASNEMAPKHAVLIHEMLRSLPYKAFATSSIDALIHCIESFLSPLANPYTEMYSVAGIREILAGYLEVVKDPSCYTKLGNMFLRASNYGGIAFNNAGCGTVHAMSYALGGKFHVPHGESNYEFLTAVLMFYREKAPAGKIARLEELIRECIGGEDAIRELHLLIDRILPYQKMSAYGAEPSDVPVFAKLTWENQQRLLGRSPVPMSEAYLAELFGRCL